MGCVTFDRTVQDTVPRVGSQAQAVLLDCSLFLLQYRLLIGSLLDPRPET